MSKLQRVVLDSPCEHASTVKVHEVARPAAGCVDCLAIGGRWVHLRYCLTCGHVGCGHPIVTSGEPGETWSYCYLDDAEVGS
jgi:hypothetical protein